ncbi:MAG TPA: putative metal-binding motif-containing protein, partial [Polyangia bacterium]
MVTGAPRAALGFFLVSVSLAALAPAAAQAAVTEPPIPPATTGESVPKPVPAAEIQVETARGFSTMAGTLNGLFQTRGETLDYVKDAQTAPGTFSPQCGFEGTLVLRGGGCHVGLGWYNVTAGSTTPPPQNQIYQLVPPTFPMCPMVLDPTMICCDDTELCPLAIYDTTQAPQHRWSMPPFSANNIRTDTRYKGGLIGFVLMGAGSNTQCSQNKYSQIELNDVSPSGQPWIGAVVYQSTVDPSSYYLGFEDQPTTTMSWKGQNNNNDGDFNDFVFYVSGITCKGGGKACDTQMMGVCANGVTQCSSGEAISCTPIVKASAEICDGLDNDCDGVVDQGSNLCPNNQVCDKGKCVGQCGTGEFQCAPGLTCDNGYCKDPSCLNVDCTVPGQICVAGKCQGGCDGVVCPQGQACVSGACLDLCAGVSCTGSQVCESGICVAPCECRGCDTGQVCAGSHHCLDTGCDKQTCNTPQMVCVGGSCKDGCAGVICPGGQQCDGGVCVQVAPTSTGGFSGTLTDAGSGSGGLGPVIITGTGGRS